MDKKNLKDFEKKIVHKLFAGEGISDYQKFTKEVAYILRGVDSFSDKEKTRLFSVIRNVAQEIAQTCGNNPTHEQIISFTQEYYQKTHSKNDAKNSIREYTIMEYIIGPKVWKELGIAPMNGVYFKGGVARHIARKVLHLHSNKNDTLDDIDAMVLNTKSINEIAQIYKSDPVGFTPISHFDNKYVKKFMFEEVDNSINQLITTDKILLITPEAIAGLNGGGTHIVANGHSLFGPRSLDVNGEKVSSASQIVRSLYFLITGKISLLEMAGHNVVPSNLELLNMDNAMLVLLRKILGKELFHPEKALLLQRLESVLLTYQIIPEGTTIFQYYHKILEDNPYFHVYQLPQTMQKYGNWIFSKYLKMKKNEIGKIEEGDDLVGYDTTDTGTLIMSCDLQKPLDANFFEEYMMLVEAIKNR